MSNAETKIDTIKVYYVLPSAVDSSIEEFKKYGDSEHAIATLKSKSNPIFVIYYLAMKIAVFVLGVFSIFVGGFGIIIVGSGVIYNIGINQRGLIIAAAGILAGVLSYQARQQARKTKMNDIKAGEIISAFYRDNKELVDNNRSEYNFKTSQAGQEAKSTLNIFEQMQQKKAEMDEIKRRLVDEQNKQERIRLQEQADFLNSQLVRMARTVESELMRNAQTPLFPSDTQGSSAPMLKEQKKRKLLGIF